MEAAVQLQKQQISDRKPVYLEIGLPVFFIPAACNAGNPSRKDHLSVEYDQVVLRRRIRIRYGLRRNGGRDMVGKYKVITLCGSTRFKDAFLEAQKRLTLEGNIVISVGLFGHSGDNEVWTEGTKEMLDDMHKRKIDMADEIFVINPGGYIGSSTRSELEYAAAAGKTVRYLEPVI